MPGSISYIRGLAESYLRKEECVILVTIDTSGIEKRNFFQRLILR